VSLIQAIILGLIQGLTEFIPVSSSGHLLLFHNLMGLSQDSLTFDVALHIGTFLALILFFYKDILELARHLISGGAKRRLALILALATVPAVIAGVLLEDSAQTTFRSPLLVCATLSLMAVVMLAAEKIAQNRQAGSLAKIRPGQGLVIGLAQAAALIPGVSRSGSTITAGLFAGLDRLSATRFSFLLSIPITFGAILKVFADTGSWNQVADEKSIFGVGIITAMLSGIWAIRFLLKFVAKHSLSTFAYYRLAVAGFSLIMLTIF
jgi:undecaprenyl-diphosphatase